MSSLLIQLKKMKLNCVVVDDSTVHRLIINRLVQEHLDLNLIGEYSNATDARKCILNKPVDLLFLDIEMPVQTGFELLDGLKSRPQIIFISSKSDYALKAFDYAAVDYLHKPVSKERFEKAVQKAKQLHLLKKENTDDDEGEHIIIKSNLKIYKIFTGKIKWIEASGDYVKIITEDESHMILSTMKNFENELSKDKFFRAHKSYIINIDKVTRFNNKYAEINNDKIPLSRGKKEDLTNAINKSSKGLY